MSSYKTQNVWDYNPPWVSRHPQPQSTETGWGFNTNKKNGPPPADSLPINTNLSPLSPSLVTKYPLTTFEILIWGDEEFTNDFFEGYNFLTTTRPIFGDFILSPFEFNISQKITNFELFSTFGENYRQSCIDFERKFGRLSSHSVFSHYPYQANRIDVNMLQYIDCIPEIHEKISDKMTSTPENIPPQYSNEFVDQGNFEPNFTSNNNSSNTPSTPTQNNPPSSSSSSSSYFSNVFDFFSSKPSPPPFSPSLAPSSPNTIPYIFLCIAPNHLNTYINPWLRIPPEQDFAHAERTPHYLHQIPPQSSPSSSFNIEELSTYIPYPSSSTPRESYQRLFPLSESFFNPHPLSPNQGCLRIKPIIMKELTERHVYDSFNCTKSYVQPLLINRNKQHNESLPPFYQNHFISTYIVIIDLDLPLKRDGKFDDVDRNHRYTLLEMFLEAIKNSKNAGCSVDSLLTVPLRLIYLHSNQGGIFDNVYEMEQFKKVEESVREIGLEDINIHFFVKTTKNNKPQPSHSWAPIGQKSNIPAVMTSLSTVLRYDTDIPSESLHEMIIPTVLGDFFKLRKEGFHFFKKLETFLQYHNPNSKQYQHILDYFSNNKLIPEYEQYLLPLPPSISHNYNMNSILSKMYQSLLSSRNYSHTLHGLINNGTIIPTLLSQLHTITLSHDNLTEGHFHQVLCLYILQYAMRFNLFIENKFNQTLLAMRPPPLLSYSGNINPVHNVFTQVHYGPVYYNWTELTRPEKELFFPPNVYRKPPQKDDIKDENIPKNDPDVIPRPGTQNPFNTTFLQQYSFIIMSPPQYFVDDGMDEVLYQQTPEIYAQWFEMYQRIKNQLFLFQNLNCIPEKGKKDVRTGWASCPNGEYQRKSDIRPLDGGNILPLQDTETVVYIHSTDENELNCKKCHFNVDKKSDQNNDKRNDQQNQNRKPYPLFETQYYPPHGLKSTQFDAIVLDPVDEIPYSLELFQSSEKIKLYSTYNVNFFKECDDNEVANENDKNTKLQQNLQILSQKFQLRVSYFFSMADFQGWDISRTGLSNYTRQLKSRFSLRAGVVQAIRSSIFERGVIQDAYFANKKQFHSAQKTDQTEDKVDLINTDVKGLHTHYSAFARLDLDRLNHDLEQTNRHQINPTNLVQNHPNNFQIDPTTFINPISTHNPAVFDIVLPNSNPNNENRIPTLLHPPYESQESLSTAHRQGSSYVNERPTSYEPKLYPFKNLSGPKFEHFLGSAHRASGKKISLQGQVNMIKAGHFSQDDMKSFSIDPFEPILPFSYLFGCYLIPLTRSNVVPKKDNLKFFYDLFHMDVRDGKSDGGGMKGSEKCENSEKSEKSENSDIHPQNSPQPITSLHLKQFSSLLDYHCPRFSHEYTDDSHPGRLQLPFFSSPGANDEKNFLHLLTPQRIIFFYPKSTSKRKSPDTVLVQEEPSVSFLYFAEKESNKSNLQNMNENIFNSPETPSDVKKTTQNVQNEYKNKHDKKDRHDEEYRRYLKWFFEFLTKKTNHETKLFLFNFLFREEFIDPVQFNYLWDAVVCLEEDIPKKILEIQAKGVAHYANLAGLE